MSWAQALRPSPVCFPLFVVGDAVFRLLLLPSSCHHGLSPSGAVNPAKLYSIAANREQLSHPLPTDTRTTPLPKFSHRLGDLRKSSKLSCSQPIPTKGYRHSRQRPRHRGLDAGKTDVELLVVFSQTSRTPPNNSETLIEDYIQEYSPIVPGSCIRVNHVAPVVCIPT